MFELYDAEHFSVRDLLGGARPAGALLLARDMPLQVACALAKQAVETGLPEQQEGKPFQAVLLLNPAAPTDPATTKLYRREWLKMSYAYRLPCGSGTACPNPEGPVTAHYASPSKNSDKTEPVLCSYCRRQAGPSEKNRAITADRNRAGRGVPRKGRVKPGSE
jgi:hypothetical protein